MSLFQRKKNDGFKIISVVFSVLYGFLCFVLVLANLQAAGVIDVDFLPDMGFKRSKEARETEEIEVVQETQGSDVFEAETESPEPLLPVDTVRPDYVPSPEYVPSPGYVGGPDTVVGGHDTIVGGLENDVGHIIERREVGTINEYTKRSQYTQ